MKVCLLQNTSGHGVVSLHATVCVLQPDQAVQHLRRRLNNFRRKTIVSLIDWCHLITKKFRVNVQVHTQRTIDVRAR